MATDILAVARKGDIKHYYFIFVNVNNIAPTATTPTDTVIPPTRSLF